MSRDALIKHQDTKLKIGTRSVHVGSLSEVSQDTCTSIVTMLN